MPLMHAEKYHFFNKKFFLAVKMGILRGFYAEFAKIYIYILKHLRQFVAAIRKSNLTNMFFVKRTGTGSCFPNQHETNQVIFLIS